MTPSPQPSQPGGCLVLRGGALGDFVLTLPALRLLHRGFPDQRLEIVGIPAWAELARFSGLADAVRRLDDPALASFFVRGAPLDPAWSSYFASFQRVVSYLFDPEGIFHHNLELTGVRTLIRGPHRPAEQAGHAARQLAAPLTTLGLVLEIEELEQPIVAVDRHHETATIALHPGSGSGRKNWDVHRWIDIVTRLHHEANQAVLLVGGEADSDPLAAAERALSAAGVPWATAHDLPLPDLARRLAHCRLFLGHDSGPAHLAAACGLPCVLVFGPTDPSVWAPAGPRVTVIRAPDTTLAAINPAAVLLAARLALGKP